MFLEPALPARAEIREWPMEPGSDLPDGPARQAIRNLADTFRDAMADAGWTKFATRAKGEYSAYAAGR
jgi:hypothetical protein